MNATTASNLSQSQTMQEVGMAVAKKSLNVYKQQGKAVLGMLESAAKLTPSMNMDLSKGHHVDQYG